MNRDPEKIEYRYFSCVEGKIARRHGAKNQYVGAKLVPSGDIAARSLAGPTAEGSFVWFWDTARVTRISLQEINMYGREYNRALSEGALIERSRRDYDAYIKSLSVEPAVAAEDAKADKRRSGKENES